MKKIKLITASLLTSLIVIITFTLGNVAYANTTNQATFTGIKDLGGSLEHSKTITSSTELIVYFVGNFPDDAFSIDIRAINESTTENFIAYKNPANIFSYSVVFSKTAALVINGTTYDNVQSFSHIYNQDNLDSLFVLSGNRNVPYSDMGEYRILMTLPDNTRPAFSGNEHFASNVDSPTPVATMINEIKAVDAVDGDISHKIIIESDNFTPNNTKLGTYDVNLSVTDTAGNKSTFKFLVTVSDVTGPNGAADLGRKVIGYDKTFNIQTFVDTIVVTDNYFKPEEITKTVTKDTYTANKTKLGVYQVEVTLKDPALNETILSFEIEVKDFIAPVINGTTEYIKSYTTLISLQDILNALSANDAIDGKIELTVVSDTFTGNGNKPSKDPYKVTVSATDKSGNTSTKEITILVNDDEGARWYITNGVTLNLPADTKLSRSQILLLLSKIGAINYSENAQISYKVDTYSQNIGVPGLYTLSFSVKEQNGQHSDYIYAVNVLGESGDDTEDVPSDPTFIDKITNHLSDNKVSYIVGTVLVIGGIAIISKVKEQVKKNKRKR